MKSKKQNITCKTLVKMKRGNIIFIGGIGYKNEFGGELTKNKMIVSYLKDEGYCLNLIDTHNAKQHPWKIFLLPYYLLLYPKSKLIISTSLENVLPLLKIFKIFRTKRKIIYWGIGGSFPRRIKDGSINRKTLSVLNLIIVEGNSMKDTLTECGIDNVIVCSNFKKIFYVPKLIKPQIPRFVFFSRIQPEKGAQFILNTAKRLNENGYENKYVIDFYGVVSPDFIEIFNDELKSFHNVNYKGTLNLNNKNGYDILSSYSAMLFPTIWPGEGFPGVIIDAYISGLPIIATDWNLNKELIIDGKTGFVVPIDNVENGIYSVMLSIINKQINIEAMSDECQKQVKKYDVQNAIKYSGIQYYL